MNKYFSVYLDFIRFFAACFVVVYHSNLRDVVRTILPLANYGHEAVIVFFVLSGFVIAYVTNEKEKTPREYIIARVSRIYSLAIPAIILTPILDIAGQSFNSAFYDGQTAHSLPAVRVLSSLLFTNEIWDVSIMYFSNIPYWSLCYEVWYYVLFGVWCFSSRKYRNVAVAAICLFVGPKVLLLLPVWLLGVLLYRWQTIRNLPEGLSWTGLAASLVAFAAYFHFDLTHVLARIVASWVGPYWDRELAFSRFFLGDWILGPIVFLHFASVRRIIHRFSSMTVALESVARSLSQYTFSIYIFHRPLLLFWAAVINASPIGYGFYAAVMVVTAGSVILLGLVTERRRYQIRRLLAGLSVRGRRPTTPRAA